MPLGRLVYIYGLKNDALPGMVAPGKRDRPGEGNKIEIKFGIVYFDPRWREIKYIIYFNVESLANQRRAICAQ